MKKWLTALALIVLLTATAEAVSPENCKSCHANEYRAWNASKHAESLKAAGGKVVSIELCRGCHVESAIKKAWGREDVEEGLEPVTCEICHAPPEGGYEAHMSNPAEAKPEVNLSAELCGKCHTGEHHPTFDEWNEFGKEGFDTKTMESHSEPTDVAEPFVLKSSKTCVACKSTEGAIANLEKPEIYDYNEENLPKEVKEWRITCAACHDPHSASLRIEDETKLCANCHNAEGVKPDGKTTEVHHPQWEMFNGSEFLTGVHPVKLGCPDCHMAMRPYNETTEEAAVTGHTFDFNAELLMSPESTNGCYDCHGDKLASLVEARQNIVKERLETLKALKEDVAATLEKLNGTAAYNELKPDYNNAVFYMLMVEEDGSYGIHNLDKALKYLDTSEELFNKVLTSAKLELEKPTPTPEQTPEQKRTPGFELIAAITSIAAAYVLRRK